MSQVEPITFTNDVQLCYNRSVAVVAHHNIISSPQLNEVSNRVQFLA
jgi:hypothetical protein